MTEDLQTLVVDDGERTLVDRGRTSTVAKTKRWGARWRAAAVDNARSWGARAVAMLCFACLGSWGHVEHRRIESLRYELDALRDQLESQEPAEGDEPSKRRPTTPMADSGHPDFLSSSDAIDRATERLEALRAPSAPLRVEEPGVRPATAAELVIRHRWPDALDSYLRLAAVRYDQPVYADVARILAIKLGCSPDVSGSGASCRR
jgi:hypothetical protein